MRAIGPLALLLCALLLATPAWGQAAPVDTTTWGRALARGAVDAPSPLEVGAYGALGALAGAGLGYLGGSDLGSAVVRAGMGSAFGAALGVHFGDRRRGNAIVTLAAGLVAGGLTTAWALDAESDGRSYEVYLPLTGVAALGASLVAELLGPPASTPASVIR